jgi:hypothetical protein
MSGNDLYSTARRRKRGREREEEERKAKEDDEVTVIEFHRILRPRKDEYSGPDGFELLTRAIIGENDRHDNTIDTLRKRRFEWLKENNKFMCTNCKQRVNTDVEHLISAEEFDVDCSGFGGTRTPARWRCIKQKPIC